MSEQEKQASGGKEGSAIVMVEQTASVKPYRPTEIQQDSDVHHKRSKAPAVPSVAEELKNLAEDAITNHDVDYMELKESERAMSSEHKHKVSKKSSKRRDSSPDISQLRSGTDSTRDVAGTKVMQKGIPSPTQPIPPQIQEEKSEPSVLQLKEDTETKEEDSIMEEITELQTPEEAKKHSEWVNAQPTKKLGVSWNDKEYQQTVVLQDLGSKSQDWFLERKASVGPCFRPGMPFEGPSGIMICVPKKSTRCINTTSGININVSRKSTYKDVTYQDKRYKLATSDNKMDCEIAYAKIYNTFKEKVSVMRRKLDVFLTCSIELFP